MSGELPKGWVEAPLAELADACLGKMLDKQKSKGSPLPYLGNINVRWGSFDTSDLKEMPFQAAEIDRYSVKAGDLVVCEGGEPGRCAIWKSVEPVMFQKALHRVRPSNALDASYLQRHISLDATMGGLDELFTGTTIKHLTGTSLAKYPVKLPPLNEQKRIVAKIDALTEKSREAREALAEVPALLDQLRQSILAAAFRGDLTKKWREQNPNVEPASVLLDRIRQERRHKWEEAELAKFKAKGKLPSDDKWKANYKEWTVPKSRAGIDNEEQAETLPQGWEWCFLGEVARLQPGYAFKSSWFQKDGVRLLRGTNIEPGSTRWRDEVRLAPQRRREFSEYELGAGDIVLAMDRPIISSGIKVARLCDADLPALLLQRVGRFRCEGSISQSYVFSLLNSSRFERHLTDRATGTQLPHVSQADIETFRIPLPPVAEQTHLVNELQLRSQAAEQAASVQTYFGNEIDILDSSILAKAFRGELVPQDPNDEPASVLLERIREEREAAGSGKKGTRRGGRGDV